MCGPACATISSCVLEGTMQALFFEEHGGTDRLTPGERPEPVAGPGQVLLDLRAAALNHLDLFVLAGMPGVPIGLPHIGGADGAGVIVAVGDGVGEWRPGDEVVINPGLWCGRCEFCRCGEESLCIRFGVLGEHQDGTFAERVVVSAAALAPRPLHLSWHESAAFGLTYLTAWRMLVTRGGLREGETVLVHGVGGGVALAALAIAKCLGATVLVTSASDGKLERARELGADIVINHRTVDVVTEVRSLTGKRGVDLVVDSVGQETWMSSLRSAARGGRIVTCGATSGPNPSEEIRLIFWNQLSILGSTMGSRRDWDAMMGAVARWSLRPIVDSVFPLSQGRTAYDRLREGKHFGKVVLSVGIDGAVGSGT
jgi:NADPH:quinone reductase-like Zn-dependent oxidoreductase